ncbi:MAG: ABC transporter ATP-binding protein [Thermoplasmata archaeon]
MVRLSKRYGRRDRPAVDDVSFSVAPGEIVGLVGLNGAGKSSTIRVAVGVSRASEGDVRVDGKSITSEKASASRALGWVPETPVHDPNRSIHSLLDYYSAMAGDRGSTDPESSLSEWGILSLARRPFRTLSMGERKRFALAVAALRDPEYYLLDEVFNGLDPAGVAQVREWMFRQRKAGRGLLVSSHQLRELQAMADRFAMIHEGRLIGEVDSDKLPVSTQGRLQVVFRPIDDRGLELLRSFGAVERSANGVVVSGAAINAAAVNRTLVEAGYEVERLEATNPDLETYFLELVRKHP